MESLFTFLILAGGGVVAGVVGLAVGIHYYK